MSSKRKKILIFAKPAIGDILLATPLMHSVRKAEPEAIIDVMCYPGQQGILEGNPDIDNIVVIEPKPSLRELAGLARRLFRKYDIAITNAADDRVHLYMLVFGRTRISVRLKDGPAWKRWITNASVLDDSQRLHALLRNNRLGNMLGFASEYRIQVPEPDNRENTSPALTAVFEEPGAYAVLHVDARLPYKRWTRSGWLDVMRHFAERGISAYLTGGDSESEQHYINDLLQDAPASAHNLAGKLTFAEVAELIRRCKTYVGIDTVNSHLAAAIGVPTVVLFGPENPVRWGPWPHGYTEDYSPWQASGTQNVGNILIIQGKSNCAACGPAACQRRHHRGTDCPLMTGINSQQVIEGIDLMTDWPV